MAIRTYDEEFVAQVKDLAIMGLYPVQIAERMHLEGEERKNFLTDILSKKHPLHEEYLLSLANRIQDLNASLVEVALSGDVDALELIDEIARKKEVDNLKKELFGV